MALNRKEIFYFCAVKMKSRLIRHSIVFVMFICVLQVTVKMYVQFSGQSDGKKESAKSAMVWALLGDTAGNPTEVTQEVKQHALAFALPVGAERCLAFDRVFCFASSRPRKDHYIPLHLSDSSPPDC
ncbi:hypothetical protein [Prolixibacter sp. NT017]|uniref:hypothetical protein n=1 Tax=Prolixibacter sp. NT017 TaxID=2652390 RepID=UPI0012994D8D|nr:hypothetical protein [Prolixibacter sp. NT017]